MHWNAVSISKKKYAYQNEFRIVAINNKKAPIDDLFIKLEEDEFQVIELKNGCNFRSLINISANNISTKKVEVEFKMQHFLEPAIK